MAQQGSPPRRSSRLPESGRSGRHGSRDPQVSPGRDQRADWAPRAERADVAQHAGRAQRESRPPRADREAWRQSDPFTAEDEAEAPPWAGPSIYATRPGGSRLRPPAPPPGEPEPGQDDGPPRRRGRAAAARLRRSRRRVYIWCGAAIAVAVIAAGVAAIHGLHKSAPASSFVTTLQAGEYRTVPSACASVGPALLSQYLPGARKVTPAGSGTGTSQCTFTVDSRPMFRVLQVAVQAYQPSAVAAGDGSATANAQDSFLLAETQLANPGKRAPLPPAQVTPLTGLGKQAFSAVQVIRAGRGVTDLVTVLARDHNVVVSVSLQAQASGDGFGPVSVATVRAGALAISRVVVAKVAAEPAVSG